MWRQFIGQFQNFFGDLCKRAEELGVYEEDVIRVLSGDGNDGLIRRIAQQVAWWNGVFRETLVDQGAVWAREDERTKVHDYLHPDVLNGMVAPETPEEDFREGHLSFRFVEVGGFFNRKVPDISKLGEFGYRPATVREALWFCRAMTPADAGVFRFRPGWAVRVLGNEYPHDPYHDYHGGKYLFLGRYDAKQWHVCLGATLPTAKSDTAPVLVVEHPYPRR